MKKYNKACLKCPNFKKLKINSKVYVVCISDSWCMILFKPDSPTQVSSEDNMQEISKAK